VKKVHEILSSNTASLSHLKIVRSQAAGTSVPFKSYKRKFKQVKLS